MDAALPVGVGGAGGQLDVERTTRIGYIDKIEKHISTDGRRSIVQVAGEMWEKGPKTYR